ncbi:hypothetical protein MTP99_014730 [Tenebrio molitor]|jgi:hypothetical protein|nr:hypothetical protein MTP99_014730 [Tenebrio molitor]
MLTVDSVLGKLCTMWQCWMVERRMRGVWPAPSYISKYSLGARGQAAEERACIDRQMKVPTCLPTQMASHRASLDAADGETEQEISALGTLLQETSTTRQETRTFMPA